MSTSLLNDLLTDHLDRGYAEAAQRRAERVAAGEPATPGHRATAAVLAVGLLLVGLLLATAYRTTARQAPASERARQALLRDIERGSTVSADLQRRVESLSGQLVRERDAALTSSGTGQQSARAVRELEEAAALVPVRGPGLVVEVGDASSQEQVDPATGDRLSIPPDDNGRLRDRDLQSLVNALWAAGAEAIAINGERLAPNTAIRAAGQAILVDLYPVTSPYRLEAIGDPNTLLPRFADTGTARRYQSYVSLYGIRFSTRPADMLELRAATGADLQHARPLDRPTAPHSSAASAPSGSQVPGGSAPTTPLSIPSRSASGEGP
jgi:uncharacterized protein YlxW (UPF0749 family)